MCVASPSANFPRVCCFAKGFSRLARLIAFAESPGRQLDLTERAASNNPPRDKFVPAPRVHLHALLLLYSVIKQSIPRGHVAARFQVSPTADGFGEVLMGNRYTPGILNTQMSSRPSPPSSSSLSPLLRLLLLFFG